MAYPSLLSLTRNESAGDYFYDEEPVKSGYVSYGDKQQTTATYFWKMDGIFFLIKNRHGVTSPLFRGPQDTTWRLNVEWGDRKLDHSQRFIKFTLNSIGSTHVLIRFRAGYEIFRGEDDFRRGHIQLDGKEYTLTPFYGTGAARHQTQIEWIHNQNLTNVLQTCVQSASLFIGVTISVIVDQVNHDCRPDSIMRTVLPETSKAGDLSLVGRDGDQVRAHKSYVSSWSGPLKDAIDRLGDQSVLRFEKYQTMTLRVFVEFIYMGDLNEVAVKGFGVELLQFINEFQIDALLNTLCSYLMRNLWREGILRIFCISDSKSANEAYCLLRDSAVKLILQNMTAVFDDFETTGFTKAEIDAIKARIIDLTLDHQY